MRKRVVWAAALGLLASTTGPGRAAEVVSCESDSAQAQLRLLAIQRMKADQLLNDMADLDRADLSLSHIETVRKPDGSISCKAVLTLSVMYSAGLRRMIDNAVTYDLLTRGEDRHLAVKIHTFATVF